MLALSACVRMPTDGPVTEVQTSTVTAPRAPFDFDPKPPQPGESATEIVTHFLEAMKAPPDHDQRRAAVPHRGGAARLAARTTPIVTYGEIGDPVGGDLTVQVPMTDDQRVRRPRAPGSARADGVTLQLRPHARRTASGASTRLPDALMVPESWFEDSYRRVSLYFFDPTDQILVPEPVYVPEGDQLASSLVPGLLPSDPHSTRASSAPSSRRASRSAFSVPITSAGIAEVSLDGDPSRGRRDARAS